MADEQPEKQAAPSAGGAPGGNNKLVMILTLVNLVICLVIAGVLVVSLKKEKAAVSVADINAEVEEEHADAGHGGGHGDAKKDDGHGGGHGGAAKEVKKVGARMMQLEQFTVNLSSPGGAAQKFVRVNISLEVPSEDVEGEVTTKAPQVRNTIIDLFNSKRPSDLATVDGREYLKEEIRTALNSFMSVGKIKGVYFTNFAVTN